MKHSCGANGSNEVDAADRRGRGDSNVGSCQGSTASHVLMRRTQLCNKCCGISCETPSGDYRLY